MVEPTEPQKLNLPEPGSIITNEVLRIVFGVGNMGGMRRSLANNLLVIVSDHTKGLYEDRWEGDVLHYTGMGTTGDQKLDEAQNKTLSESPKNGVAIYLFEVFEPGRYVYAGQVELVGIPYEEEQPDADQHLRKVWMFPIRLKAGGTKPIPKISEITEIEKAKARALSKLSLGELKARAKKAKAKPAERSAAREQYSRDPYVSAYVKKAAQGHCDLCHQEAPFQKDGEPFLHCHHVLWLSRGGPDIIQNTVALCPNCHERMHQLDRQSDVQRLLKRASERDPDLLPFIYSTSKPQI